MAAEAGPDRSSIEIKGLLRKLHPDKGNHNDRIRRLGKFRNFVMGDGKGKSPGFYDDDIPLLFLGSKAPAAFLDEVDDDTLAGLYGLLNACGTPSGAGENEGKLKRSARHAVNLLKWLLMDWKEANHKKGDLNQFAQSFLSLPAHYYHHMQLDIHVIGDDRGGAKEDSCQIIVFILTQHLSEDSEGPQPLSLEEVLSNPKAQQEFEIWSARHTSASVQDQIKKNAAARQGELALQQRQDALASKAMGGITDDYEAADDSENSASDRADDVPDEPMANDGYGDDEGDVMAAFRKRKKAITKDLKDAMTRGDLEARHGVAVRWEDSQLAREQRARAASAARAGAGAHETVRDSQEAAAELAEREEGKAKVLGKDPLGLAAKGKVAFDLQAIEKAQAEQIEQGLYEFQEEYQKAEGTGDEKLAKAVAAQKESLEALVERCGGIEAMENTANLKRSVLPTNQNFDPILFLTLVHRATSYDILVESMGRLTNKTESQAEQLQNLVRDNFPLFVRCAEGLDEFRQNAEQEVGPGVDERIDKLEAISESAAFQAHKSFKPLLDNTSEVRKVQSAMAVLQRVAPILQVPALMRQHLENRRYSQALKTYRRVLVVDDNCNISLLNHVKHQAEKCVLEARRDLERRLAMSKVPIEGLVDGIRDLSELLELDVPTSMVTEEDEEKAGTDSKEAEGVYDIGGFVISVREHPPALACLILQAAHFTLAVKLLVGECSETCGMIFSVESPSPVKAPSGDTPAVGAADPKANRGNGNQWKYDVLDARVLSTVKAVAKARLWLPRLVRVAKAAREDEKRRAARIGSRRRGNDAKSFDSNQLTAFEVFVTNITPSLTKLVEHATFCALGSNNRSGGKEVVVSFGQDAPEKLSTLLRSPLPPSQSSKVGTELAELVEILSQNSGGANALRPDGDASVFRLSPLDECKAIGDYAVVIIEKRRCIYAFDVCARVCANKASGSGKFDADALLSCLQNLSEQLSCPEECANEVEKGCELVVRRCCEGLASYVRDRGDAARLNAVAECADVMSDRMNEIVREVGFLTANADAVQEVMMEDIMGLESAMFDEYLESLRQNVVQSTRVGWLDTDTESSSPDEAMAPPSFPAYLSSSLLAIVRCRAQVEQALGSKVRRLENVTYHHLAMSTVAGSAVEGICAEVLKYKSKMKVRQADRLANELDFLKNTLKKFLNGEVLVSLIQMLQLVSAKAGRGRGSGYQGDGPDGLAALEELERLGRVYVLCLGE